MITLKWDNDRKIWLVFGLYHDIITLTQIGFIPTVQPISNEFYYAHFLTVGTFMIACQNAGIGLKVEI